MNISILLPYKENFATNNAGAVSLFVNDITQNSIYKKTTKIFGNTIYKKILSNNYVNLAFDRKIFFISNNSFLNVLLFLRLYSKDIASFLVLNFLLYIRIHLYPFVDLAPLLELCLFSLKSKLLVYPT